jgi:hypothetical protein
MYYFVNFFTVLFPDLESKFLDVIGTKVFKVSPLLVTVTPGQKWFETGLKCKHYLRKSQSENSQDYAQKPHRNNVHEFGFWTEKCGRV